MDGNKAQGESMEATEGLFPIIWDLWRSSLPQVLSRSELWFFCGINLATWGAFQVEHASLRSNQGVNFDLGSNISVDWVDLKMLTMISTTLLAFYVHQCFGRYQLICTLTTRMLSSAHDVAFQARLFLSPSIRAWRKLVARGFVKRYEVEPLRRMGPARRWLLLQKVTHLVATEVSDKVLGEMMGRVLAMKDYQQEILETRNLWLPFRYHHLLTVVIMVNLLLLSYGSALSTSCLAPPVFFLITIFFFGMMEVSVQLWNPLAEESRLQVPKLTEEISNTPESGPSQPPMEMSSIANQMSEYYGEDVLFEVWSNGRRYAIGREGDPDDADHDQRMAVPLRVLQLLANEARSRQRRRQREEDSCDFVN
eukprot:s1141_g10.t1